MMAMMAWLARPGEDGTVRRSRTATTMDGMDESGDDAMSTRAAMSMMEKERGDGSGKE